jgi:hypothetical protein
VDKLSDQEKFKAGTSRKPYVQPKVVRHGDVSELTLAKNAPGKEPTKTNGSQIT